MNEEVTEMQTEERPRLLDCKQAAKYLGISEPALRKRIHLRQIRGLVKLGGRVYFDREKLSRFIDELEVNKGGRK